MLQQKWLAVVNEKAKGKKAGQEWPEILRILIEHGVHVETQYTQKAGDAINLTRMGLQKGFTGIIAVGGDGTLNEAVNGFWREDRLINPEARLTYVNLGSGGDFARMINVIDFGKETPEQTGRSTQTNRSAQPPSPAAIIANNLLNGNLETVDIGRVTFEGESRQSRYFVNAANVGVGAEAVRRVNKKETKPGGGRLSYMLSALAAVVTFSPQPLRVVVDGACKIDEDLYAVMVCNGQYIGAGMMIAPDADITDGLFDIVAIPKMPLFKLLMRFPKIYKGTHLGIQGVSLWRGTDVEITDSRPAVSHEKRPHGAASNRGFKSLVEIDGEILGSCPVSYTLLPKGMKMWLPRCGVPLNPSDSLLK
ncbi:MAG: diacylglycerol kinase family lipid kinase [Peptococcaceae bacterium]|nr:diacylglycerol kinase family lipid kinase [Peptococcaceae bacterium]